MRKKCKKCDGLKEPGRGRSLCSKCGGGLSRHEYARLHYQENKDHYQTYFNEYRAAHKEKRILEAAKHRAKKRGLSFTLTVEDICIPDVCPVFGIKLEKGAARHDSSPTLDRIDNTRGYEKDNVIVVSWRANRLKADATPEELKQLANFYYQLVKGE